MAIKYINGSMYDSLQAQAVSLIQRPTTTEEMVGTTPQQKFIEGADLTSAPVSPDLIKPVKEEPIIKPVEQEVKQVDTVLPEAQTFGAGKPEEKIMSETLYDRPASQDMQAYKEFIKEEEGKKLKAYKPVESEENYTIGYGHYGTDVTKDMVITDEQAEQLLEDDISKRLPVIRKAIPNFDKMPLEVRRNLLGSWFRGSLSGSPKTLRLINEGKFEEAAKEFLNNNEYRTTTLRGVKRRMEATAQAIASLSL